jgi:hypothetical protein
MDIIGMLLLLLGTWLLGNKNKNGWLISITGATFFLISGYMAKLYGIALFELIYIGVAIYNYIKQYGEELEEIDKAIEELIKDDLYDQIGGND